MEQINIYKKRYRAIEAFYKWIDSGIDYDTAVELANHYSVIDNDIDDILLNVTITTRFERSGWDISESLKNRLKRLVPLAKEIDWQEYGLTEHEIKSLKEDITAAEYFIRTDKQVEN